MTSFYETKDDHKGMWHWMAITLSLAQTTDLHRDPASAKMDPKKKSLSKRIWWSCFMRESVIALGMRRPTRIKDEDFDVPMLALDDFDVQVLSSKIHEMLGHCLFISDTAQMQQLATMCIEKAKLCVCIGNVLTAQYSVHRHEVRRPTGRTMMPFPKNEEAWHRQIQKCEEAIQIWYEQLPPDALYTVKDFTKWQRISVVKVHQALLNMFYLALCSTLHCPQSQLSPPSDDSTVSNLQDKSRQRVCSAADEITKIIHDINETDLTRYLPTSGVAVCLSAMVSHLLDPNCNDEARTKTCVKCHQQCMEVFRRLRDTDSSADLATSLLQTPIHMANLSVAVVPQTSDVELERRKKAFLAALTPPPETCMAESSSWTSERLRLFEEESPSASEEVDGSASPGRAAVAEEMKNSANCDTDLDTDFDALFDLDADMDFLASGGTGAPRHSDAERTCLSGPGGSVEQPSFSQERLHDDPITTNMRICIQV